MKRFLLALLLALCSLSLTTPAAPLPRARPRPPADVGVGRWSLTWNGDPWLLVLHKDGSAEDISGESRWVGQWSYNVATRELWLREKPANRDASEASAWLTWSVLLCPKLKGTAVLGEDGKAGKVTVSLKREGR